MLPRHRVSRAAIELIKRFEGYRRKAAALPAGGWTIGHGHTLTAREGAEVSENDAEALLLYDLIGIAHGLNEAVFSPLTQNQFDALSSFAFSIGLDNFGQSGVLKRLNEGALIQAACGMELWRKAEIGGERIVIDALVRRRSAEKTLFLTPADNAWVPAPSPILRPLLDLAAHDIVPREAPAVVTATMDGDEIVVTREDGPLPPPEPPEEETHGPALAAAEVITARLQTIFADEPTSPPAAAPPEPVGPPVHPEQIPADPHPQADFGPPIAFHEPPFTLQPPSEHAGDEDDDRLVGGDEFEVSDDGPSGADLFDPPAPREDAANDGDGGLDEDLAFLSRLPEGGTPDAHDLADFDFVAPAVQPLPEAPRGGLLALVASAVLGLAFFGGGVFWATNARPISGAMWLDPRVVGWLAGIAGVGFFVVAAFVLLERLGEASERTARNRR